MTDESELLRLFFSDEHYFDGTIKDVAISLDDLKERGLSLDIKAIVDPLVMEKRAEQQSLKKPEERHTAFVSEVVKNKICSIHDPEGREHTDFLFEILATPLADNPAHASLFCINKNKKRAFYVMARNKLKPLFLEKIVQLSTWGAPV